MREQPEGAGLLWQARETLLRELLASLPEERKYEGLMVAAAMAIAARELEHGDARRRHAHALLAELQSDLATTPADTKALGNTLDQGARRLAADIRAGRHDGDARVHSILYRLILDRLAENNPKLLAARNLTPESPE